MPSSKSGRDSISGAPPKGQEPQGQKPQGQAGGRVFFEFMAAGASMRVTAIDERSGLEATIVGPANGGRAALERAALSKLRYVLARANTTK